MTVRCLLQVVFSTSIYLGQIKMSYDVSTLCPLQVQAVFRNGKYVCAVCRLRSEELEVESSLLQFELRKCKQLFNCRVIVETFFNHQYQHLFGMFFFICIILIYDIVVIFPFS